MAEPGDIEDIRDDYDSLKELYEQVSEEPMTPAMREYLEMIEGAMEAVEGRVTRDEMRESSEGNFGSDSDLRKSALIEYSRETITYYTDSEGRRRQRITHEWPDWVPVDWDDSWEDWRASGGY